MERVKLLLVSLVISLFFTGQVGAITITDVYYTDSNTITSVVENQTSKELVVYEDYGENYLASYPSHDGYAIVNKDGKFFDKVVTFTEDDLKCCCGGYGYGNGGCQCDPGTWTFEFQVHNTSPYTWSDYHFEFWNEDFTERYKDFPLLTDAWSSNIFQKSEFDGSVLQFWAPNWQDPYEENQFLLEIDLSLSQFKRDCTYKGDKWCLCDGQNAELFGIRQVATTVPEPTTMLLLGSGLIGLGWFGRRRTKKG